MAGEPSMKADLMAALRSPIPWIALAIPLVVTIVGWKALADDAASDASKQFEARAQSAESAVRVRLRAYEQMLVAGAAFFGASKEVTRAQWAEFVSRLKLTERYPGILGIGFAERVRHADLDRHLKRVRADGMADYDIAPPGDRDNYVVIVYNEPYKGRNTRTIGIDVYNQLVMREAILRAFETGEAAISARVPMPGENAAGQERTLVGFVMYIPVFRAGMPTGTKEERDAALAGFMFSTFRMKELASGVLDKGLSRSLDLAIYDGTKLVPDALLADVREGGGESLGRAARPVFNHPASIDFGGRSWTAVFSSRPEFDARAQEAVSAGVLAVGLAMSAALFALGLMLVAARSRGTAVTLHDPLTQLYNNRYLEETMARELPRAKRASQGVGLVLIDVDNFKSIVDKFGKECGDHVLKEFAAMMLKNTRESDIKCRFAGSEFALGMPGASIENARARAEKLREVLEAASLQCAGKDLGKVTLSAGVAAFPEHGEDWSAIVQRAHRALYAAKGEGRNRVNVAA